MKSISMNLTREYLNHINKDGAELKYIVCELLQNYMDSGSYELFINEEQLKLTSYANPGIEQLLVLGVSTKQNDDSKAGQFAEGNKLAALLSTRRRNTEMIIDSPKGRITFEFKKPAHFNVPLLHANIDPSKKTEQFITTVNAKGLIPMVNKCLLPPEFQGQPLIPKKHKNEITRVYSHDLYIGDFKDLRSSYHLNLKAIQKNRDRSIPDMWDLKIALRNELERIFTLELAEEILKNPGTIEAQVIGECGWLDSSTKDMLAAAFHEMHGETAVIESGSSYANERSKKKGFAPVRIPDVFRESLSGIISKVEDTLSQWDDITRSTDDHDVYLGEIQQLMELLDIPAEIIIFEGDSDEAIGLAKWNEATDLVQVWLSDKIMRPGTRQKRLATVLHELGHLESKAGDETWRLEHSLTSIAGKLAVKLLDKI